MIWHRPRCSGLPSVDDMGLLFLVTVHVGEYLSLALVERVEGMVITGRMWSLECGKVCLSQRGL
jgi:hypothetical protein